ncbi:MAG: CTP synthase [Candidatus Staskawiczbacteria bacterium RIFCSPHIGHO2_02_FULL_34_10]|uniref:CTP synthase n=2 Tax=Candidatus Staskawicziibacteriota TaxID=1817916 RepID=A0A1G2HKH2_9BACT|nr:MAG: CTP synthase [Candidatus Staskawiczbacteria bacterium RIFCSPHIGHO2_01_FULL_34_27]OGZ67085.1 MAG: CTP synthase [Candidatus Staskawiczbacteria bacterium RIFCSPHIGHO2_02_FULL_34_10]
MSGIGKGVATASIGRILKSKGFRVTAIKIDPYINVDAGTMNPVEHGEVFVTEDGTECDQDIGNYERFLDENIYTDNYMTTGRVYQSVINKERNLEYNGKCVEVVPDIPNEVIATIKRAGKKVKADFVLIEIGGTVGEYQNLLFLEAARMLKIVHPRDVLFILVSYMPVPEMIGEMKTKPTQYAVRTLNSAGIQPDIILARSIMSLDEQRKKKLSNFCNVQADDIISAPDVASIYEVPINFEKEDLGNRILKKFNLKSRQSNLKDWDNLVKVIKNSPEPIEIGIVGKYFESGKFTLTDSYISVIEAVKHACFAQHRKPRITWVSAEDFEKNPKLLKNLNKFHGIIVPGGFGNRGVEGKIKTIEYCRKNNIPFLGLCLGMQLAVIEFSRNVCGLKDATSREFKQKSNNIVIDVMSDQKELIKEKKYGGTMRLGAYECEIKENTISQKSYGLKNISERHRHRYELNNKYRQILQDNGMIMAGLNNSKDLVEIIELKDHPFFVATQFHPEFKSRPLKPHPLFLEFIRTATKK